jgi:hypothetical protein
MGTDLCLKKFLRKKNIFVSTLFNRVLKVGCKDINIVTNRAVAKQVQVVVLLTLPFWFVMQKIFAIVWTLGLLTTPLLTLSC